MIVMQYVIKEYASLFLSLASLSTNVNLKATEHRRNYEISSSSSSNLMHQCITKSMAII